jgi:hypothetical protein
MILSGSDGLRHGQMTSEEFQSHLISSRQSSRSLAYDRHASNDIKVST